MKLKELFYGLGIKPPVREYGFDIKRFVLEKDGAIEYAAWRHPLEKPKQVSQAAVDVLRGFLTAGDFAIDIGAHTGDSTLPIALAVGASGGVFGLEPNPYVYDVLQANAGLNRAKSRIYPLMFAATPEDGEYEFQYSDPGFCNGGLHDGVTKWRHAHFYKLRVQGRNLQTYLQREFPAALAKIRYVKIDAEGSDHAVAKSIRGLLTAYHPYIKTEMYKHLPLDQRVEYYRWLRELGYTIHRWQSHEDYFGPILTEQDMGHWRNFDVFAVPGEAH